MFCVFFIAFFFLSNVSLLCSAEEGQGLRPQCPTSFECQNLVSYGYQNSSSFEYPFYNSTDTQCGLFKVDCNKATPELQLQNHQSLEIKDKWYNGMVLYNETFQKLLYTRSCDVFDNFTFPSPLFISRNITLFKCENSPGYIHNTDAVFEHFHKYDKCNDHYIYFNTSISVLAKIPSNCVAIQLPMSRPEEGTTIDPSDPFPLLTAWFTLSWDPCIKCYHSNRQCRSQENSIECVGDEGTRSGRRNLRLILVSALSAGAVLLLLVMFFHFRRKFVQSRKTQNYQNVEAFLKNHEFLAPKRYSYQDIKKMTDSFKLKLGQGGYGSVYKGKLSNDTLVAVKIMNEAKGNGEDFVNEVASVGRTSHVNIVSLLGFCFERSRRALIYEFMPNGSLEKFIHDRSSVTNHQLEWEKLYQIVVGIARGLQYLHRGCNTRILHFDIKPHNILLDQDFCPKISDFGLAKLDPQKRSKISMSGMRGTPGYIAPEVFSRNFGEISSKSDVYSYGMMVLEMVGWKNTEVGVEHSSEIYFPNCIYKKLEADNELGLHGIVHEEENQTAKKMTIVGLWCIQTNPLNRPTITKVLDMLEGGLELLEIPPKPYLSSPLRSVDSLATD